MGEHRKKKGAHRDTHEPFSKCPHCKAHRDQDGDCTNPWCKKVVKRKIPPNQGD